MIRATSNERPLARLRSICLSLPESSETASWGHPNFKAGKKTFVAFERVKGRASIAFRLDPDEVEAAVAAQASSSPRPTGAGQWVVCGLTVVDWRAGGGSRRAQLSRRRAEADADG